MKVAIIGGTGYGAVELLRLLHIHPYAEVKAIISHSNAGNSLTALYPHTDGFVEGTMETFDISVLKEKVDFAFFCCSPWGKQRSSSGACRSRYPLCGFSW